MGGKIGEGRRRRGEGGRENRRRKDEEGRRWEGK